MHGQGGGAPAWSIAVHWVRWPLGFLGSEEQGQLPPAFFLGPPCIAIKQSGMVSTCAWLGDSQAKPSCESKLAVDSARSRVHWNQLLLI